MSSQNSAGAKYIIVLLIILIGFPVALYFAKQKSINYQLNGTEVKATVVGVSEKKVRGTIRKTVTVTYENEDGEVITAKAINPGSVLENDTIVGRVVPETPEEVFLEPSGGMTFLVYVLMGLIYLGALFMLIAMILGRNISKKMARQGKIAEAVIIRRELIEGNIFVDVEFKDENGIVRRGSCRVPEYIDTNNRICTIRYLPKPKNKAVCEMSM